MIGYGKWRGFRMDGAWKARNFEVTGRFRQVGANFEALRDWTEGSCRAVGGGKPILREPPSARARWLCVGIWARRFLLPGNTDGIWVLCERIGKVWRFIRLWGYTATSRSGEVVVGRAGMRGKSKCRWGGVCAGVSFFAGKWGG